ncbi:MAG: hypothetical protein ACQEQ4_03950 [Fibrobacterota bacterium]
MKHSENEIIPIQRLLRIDFDTPLAPDFIRTLEKFYDSFAAYQEGFLKTTPVGCVHGCYSCCYHWVEDVYSFEGIIIADYIQKYVPERVEAIREQCQRDEAVLERIWEEVVSRSPGGDEELETRLLLAFHKEKLPCPLLNKKGRCMAYAVRPITCRCFFSTDSTMCRPENNHRHTSRGTLVIPPDEELEEYFDEIHEAFNDHAVTGLRALLARLL